MNADAYLHTLLEVDTVRMPRGTLFYANKAIYQVIETAAGGFSRARQWRRDESTDVALVPGSFLARTLPLVRKGHILPVYRSRTELTDENGLTGFLFPTEALAKDAAYLDVALITNGSAYVRNHGQEPAFAVTDGSQIFRLYFFMKSVHGRDTHIHSNVVENPHCELRAHTTGPMYWHLLSTWQDSLPISRVTQVSPIANALKLPELDHPDPSDVTQPTRAVRRDVSPPDPGEVTRIARPFPKDFLSQTPPIKPPPTPPPVLSVDDTHPSMPSN